MPWKSRWTVDVPQVDFPTWIFPKQTGDIGSRGLIHHADSAEKHHLTLTTYRDWAKRLAAGLIAHGFKPGDRLLLYSGNSFMTPVVLMGTVMAQGVFSGANPGYVARELAYQLKDSGAKFLLVTAAGLDVGLEAADSVNFPRDHVFVFDSGIETLDGTAKPVQGIRPWTDLIASEQEGEKFRWPKLTGKKDTNRMMVLNYSSGTTGVPKGVMISHRNYVANAVQTYHMDALDPEYKERVKRARWLAYLPMYHAYAQTFYTATAPFRGIPSYVMPKYDFVKFLQHIQNHKISHLNLVPPIAVALSKRPETKEYDISTVTGAGSGAAPLGNEQAREFERLWPKGQVNITNGWGMTEVTCSMTGWHPTERTENNSIGELNPNCEAKIMGEDEKTEMPRNKAGEFWVRGPNVMLGYWNKPDATKETLTKDGWLKTGDIAYLDDNDRIWIVDRKKELIKVKGNQVAPAELEALLMDIDGITDAAVIGVTMKGEEYPRAYLVKRSGTNIDEKQVQKIMEKKVARHKRLVGGVKFIDEIPKNPSGKILRKELREQAKKEIGDSHPRESRL